MIIRSLFARLAFLVNNKGLKDWHKGIKAAKRSMMALAAVTTAGTLVIGGFLREAAKLEQIEVAFKTMLGGAQLAKETLAELFEFARVTPFEIPGVLGTARILLGMGSTAKELRPQLKMVGDVAAGLSVPLEQIALSFGKVQAAGYLTGYELQNLRRAGVPLVRELSKITGKEREEVQHLVRTRKISFDLFQQAFENMTEAGGTFHNLMFEQAKTLLGIISNVKDAIRIVAMETGKILLPRAKEFMRVIMIWLETNKEILKLRIGKFLKVIGLYLSKIGHIIWEIIRSAYWLAESLGGVEKVLKAILFGMTAIIGLGFAQALGYITISVIKLIASLTTLGLVGGLTPILIGTAIVALGIILDDLYRYLSGKKGKAITKWFDESFFSGKIKSGFESFKNWIEEIKLSFIGLKMTLQEHAELLKNLWGMWSGLATLNFSKFKSHFKNILNMGKEKIKEKFTPQYFMETIKGIPAGMAQTVRNIGAVGEGLNLVPNIPKATQAWKDAFPDMKDRFKDFLNFPSDVDRYIGQSIRDTKTNRMWAEKLRPISIKINQALNNVTREDSNYIAEKTSKAIKEIVDYHNIVF